MYLRLAIFLIINFGALALGGIFTSAGTTSDWYVNANQAPWTPPGWVFGAAWTTIMICLSFYMASAWEIISNRKFLFTLFSVQWVLNVLWNPIFFYFREPLIALIVISSLTILVGYFLFGFREEMKAKSLLILPYFVWLLIATSLNAYYLTMN